MKKPKRLRHYDKPKPGPIVPRTEEQKQHDLEAVSGVAAFAGAFIGALGGAMAGSKMEPSPMWPPLPGFDPPEAELVEAIEDLIDAKIARTSLLADNIRVDNARDALRKEVGSLLRRIDEKRSR